MWKLPQKVFSRSKPVQYINTVQSELSCKLLVTDNTANVSTKACKRLQHKNNSKRLKSATDDNVQCLRRSNTVLDAVNDCEWLD